MIKMFKHSALKSQLSCSEALLDKKQLRSSDEGWNNVSILHFYSIDSDVLRFLSCDKCTYCESLWTKVSAEYKINNL